MHIESDAPVQPQKTPKPLTRDKITHRLIRHGYFENVGSTGAGKNSVRVQRRFFQPAFFGKLDDFAIKTRPKRLKICRHDHKVLVNISTEGIDESLHGFRRIEEFPNKNGVFSRTQKLRFKKARDSQRFCTRQEGLESLQRPQRTITISCIRIDKGKSYSFKSKH